MQYINRLLSAFLLLAAGLVAGIQVANFGIKLGLSDDLAFSGEYTAPDGYLFLDVFGSAWYVNLPPYVYWVVAILLALAAIYLYFVGDTDSKKSALSHE
ncbi:MAG: hypothetical protein WD335_03715 [Candidatus Paceibacterota bacterium]